MKPSPEGPPALSASDDLAHIRRLMAQVADLRALVAEASALAAALGRGAVMLSYPDGRLVTCEDMRDLAARLRAASAPE